MGYTMRQCLKHLSRTIRDEIDELLKHRGYGEALHFAISDPGIVNHAIALAYVFIRDREMEVTD